MSSEKNQPLYVPDAPFDENGAKQKKSCSKTLLTWILAALLVALVVALSVEFLFPAIERRNVSTIHVYEHDVELSPFEKITDVTEYPENNRVVLLASTKSPDTENDETHLQPWHMDFLINPTKLCNSRNRPDTEAYQNDPEVKLLLLVTSAVSNFNNRRTIRNTWGSVAQNPNGPVRLGFVLGTTLNVTEQELVRDESENFGDIIQADFQDSFKNLTAKSVLMLKWVSQYCPHAQYFFKADDDSFINIDVVQRLLTTIPYQQDKFIGGFVHRGARPFRMQNEKYYVSPDEYDFDEYPPYVSGCAYVTTGPTAAEMFEASKLVRPFFPMDDVFITGLIADTIQAPLIHDPSFIYEDPPRPINWDSYRNLAAAHSVTPDEIELLWDQMTKSIFDSLGLVEAESVSSDNWLSSNSKSSSDLTVQSDSSNWLDSMFPDYKSLSDMSLVKSGVFRSGVVVINNEDGTISSDSQVSPNFRKDPLPKLISSLFDWPQKMFVSNFMNMAKNQEGVNNFLNNEAPEDVDKGSYKRLNLTMRVMG